MSENQKLREALQAISHIDDSTNHAVDASAALDRIGQIARQALALPTAAPVGDLPELPEAYGYFDIRGSAADGYTADQMRAYARAALRAGDAVDAQRYRWLRDEAWAGYNKGKGFPHVFTIDGAGNRRTMLAEDALDASIDAAMRKGQL